MATERKALKTIIRAGSGVMAAGIVLIFAQFVLDVVIAVRDVPARSQVQAGSYPIALVMLMIGAALVVLALIAARPPREPGSGALRADPPGAGD